MRVLLSIKPEYANKIFDKTKKYEFRRSIFKNPSVKTVVVYASSPVQKVIGEFDIDRIICDDLQELWNKTKKYSGISEKYFFDYFASKEKGFAIKIRMTRRYEEELDLMDAYSIQPPQSFAYIE